MLQNKVLILVVIIARIITSSEDVGASKSALGQYEIRNLAEPAESCSTNDEQPILSTCFCGDDGCPKDSFCLTGNVCSSLSAEPCPTNDAISLMTTCFCGFDICLKDYFCLDRNVCVDSKSPTTSPTTPDPTKFPSKFPSEFPTINPTKNPTEFPSEFPTTSPTSNPTQEPTRFPSKFPTTSPTGEPTRFPSKFPTNNPTQEPTQFPSKFPTNNPTQEPTQFPSKFPTFDPTQVPTRFPSKFPTTSPTQKPTQFPSKFPTTAPTTKNPTRFPSKFPTTSPTNNPTQHPTKFPSKSPTTTIPTNVPTKLPTTSPTISTTQEPTRLPSKSPTNIADQMSKLETENKQLKEENANTADQMSKLQTENKQLKNENANAVDKMSKLETENIKPNDENANADKMSKLETENIKLNDENANIADQMSKLQTENKQLKEENANAVDKMSKLETENIKLNDENANADKMSKLETENIKLKDENAEDWYSTILPDVCHGIRRSTCGMGLTYVALMNTETVNPELNYQCPDGSYWATVEQYNTIRSISNMCSESTYVYKGECGWKDYVFDGVTRYDFIFNDGLGFMNDQYVVTAGLMQTNSVIHIGFNNSLKVDFENPTSGYKLAGIICIDADVCGVSNTVKTGEVCDCSGNTCTDAEYCYGGVCNTNPVDINPDFTVNNKTESDRNLNKFSKPIAYDTIHKSESMPLYVQIILHVSILLFIAVIGGLCYSFCCVSNKTHKIPDKDIESYGIHMTIPHLMEMIKENTDDRNNFCEQKSSQLNQGSDDSITFKVRSPDTKQNQMFYV